MPRTMIDISEFRDAVKNGERPSMAVRLATSGEPRVNADTRTITFVFSDETPDRCGDTIKARGWQLDEFAKNSVALFGHDSTSVENVIGRARNVRVTGSKLMGDIEFMEASVNPNADIVFRMVKGGFLNAVSVGFLPLEWKPDKQGGISFEKQSLLEISVVPIPANPNALVQARAAGINVDRLNLSTRSQSLEARRREAAELVFKIRRTIARIGEDRQPQTREQRLVEAHNFRRVVDSHMAGNK